MKHLFVPYEIALQLKEKGFNESCFGYYYPNVPNELYHAKFDVTTGPILLKKEDFVYYAPLYQQVIDWFIKEHKITIDTSADECNDGDSGDGPMFEYFIKDWKNLKMYSSKSIQYLSRKEAYNKAIEEALKLI